MASPADNLKTNKLAFQLVLFLLGECFFLYLLYELKVLVICLIFALTIASAMTPVARWAEKRKIPRLATVLLIYLVIALVYVFLVASLIPTVLEQAKQLYEASPKYIAKITSWYHSLLNLAGDQQNFLKIDPEFLQSIPENIVQRTLKMSAGIMGLAANTVLTLFLAAYFTVEGESICKGLLAWLPPAARNRWQSLIIPLEGRLGGYVRGQLLVAFCVGVFLFAGFSIIGLKYALVLGLLAGLLNLVPYIGSLIATIAAVVVGFNQDPIMALWVFLVYAVEQWVESTFMVPNLLGKSVSLHPLIVLLVIIVGATLLGVAGALISVPLTSAAIFIAEEFYLKPMQAKEENSAHPPDDGLTSSA